jgi:hypothetical protein
MIPKPNLTQWIAIIGFSASVIGYVVHLENIHVQDSIDRDRSVKQRDSIIQAMAAQSVQINEIKATFAQHDAKDITNKAEFDIRMDATETGLKVLETRFNDFIYYQHKTK